MTYSSQVLIVGVTAREALVLEMGAISLSPSGKPPLRGGGRYNKCAVCQLKDSRRHRVWRFMARRTQFS